MKKTIIAFDIDGTLRNNKKEYGHADTTKIVVNERIRTLLIILSSFKNVECHIWSGGGELYAKQVRNSMLLQKYVKENHCHGKNLEKTIGIPYFKPDIAIDDMQVCELGIINLIVKEK